MPNQFGIVGDGPGPRHFTWNGQRYFAPGDGTLYRVDGVQHVRTTDGSDLAAAQAWWETQIPLETINSDGTVTFGPDRGSLRPPQTSNASTMLIFGAVIFVILLARR